MAQKHIRSCTIPAKDKAVLKIAAVFKRGGPDLGIPDRGCCPTILITTLRVTPAGCKYIHATLDTYMAGRVLYDCLIYVPAATHPNDYGWRLAQAWRMVAKRFARNTRAHHWAATTYLAPVEV